MSNEHHLLSVTGCLMPVTAQGEPPWLLVPGSAALHLPLFRRADKAAQMMEALELQYAGLQLIADGDGFLQAVPLRVKGTEIKIILDPHFNPDGTVGWTEIRREAV